jgi:tryptophan synthase beta chain
MGAVSPWREPVPLDGLMGKPQARGRFGEYGGRYAPESLVVSGAALR